MRSDETHSICGTKAFLIQFRVGNKKTELETCFSGNVGLFYELTGFLWLVDIFPKITYICELFDKIII